MMLMLTMILLMLCNHQRDQLHEQSQSIYIEFWDAYICGCPENYTSTHDVDLV